MRLVILLVLFILLLVISWVAESGDFIIRLRQQRTDREHVFSVYPLHVAISFLLLRNRFLRMNIHHGTEKKAAKAECEGNRQTFQETQTPAAISGG
jgi:hypothetical protein